MRGSAKFPLLNPEYRDVSTSQQMPHCSLYANTNAQAFHIPFSDLQGVINGNTS
jgi:hypothetical protein